MIQIIKKIIISLSVVFIATGCVANDKLGKVDKSFLEDIQETVQNRHEQANNGVDNATIINTELGRLSSYKDQEFKDLELKKIAIDYIEGVEIQKEALDFQYAEYQIKWQEGVVKRYSALKELYNNYNSFRKTDYFEDSYLNQLESEKNLLEKYNSINDDLYKQFKDIYVTITSEGEMPFKFTNNTDYNYDCEFTLFIFNGNDERIFDAYDYKQTIKTGQTINLSFYIPQNMIPAEGRYEIYWNILPN